MDSAVCGSRWVGWYGAFTTTWVDAVCRVKKCPEHLGCWTEPPYLETAECWVHTDKDKMIIYTWVQRWFIRFPIEFSQHLINNGYTFGPINELMGILHLTKKGRHMNTLEKSYICLKTTRNSPINDKVCINEKSTPDTIIQERLHTWRHPALKPSQYTKQITSFQGHFMWWEHEVHRTQVFTLISNNAINLLKPSVSLRATRLNIQNFYFVLALRWVFCTDLRTDSDFC
jgi:hypothetical protein